MLNRIFDFIEAHYGVFFWLAWAYLIAVGFCGEAAGLPKPLLGALLLPVNLVSWPVALACRRDIARGKAVPTYRWKLKRGAFALLLTSVILPLYYLWDILIL